MAYLQGDDKTVHKVKIPEVSLVVHTVQIHLVHHSIVYGTGIS